MTFYSSTTRPSLSHWSRLIAAFELNRTCWTANSLAMEGLRGFAVFLVFCVHFFSLMGLQVDISVRESLPYHILSQVGHLGVDIFFVLSGYLIYGSISKSVSFDFLVYARRRLRRIYPTFLVVFVLYLVLSVFFPQESKIPADWLAACFYIVANLLFLPGIAPIQPIIIVSWSLSYEVLFYILCPAMALCYRHFQLPRSSRIAVTGGLITLLAFILPAVGGPSRMLYFMVGVLLVEGFLDRTLVIFRKMLVALPVGLLALLLLMSTWLVASKSAFFNSVALLTGLFAAFIFIGITLGREAQDINSRNAFQSVMSVRWIRYLGNMSYSYYLIHGLALKAFFLVVGKLNSAKDLPAELIPPLFLLAFLVTLPPSIVLYLIIERPFSLRVKKRAA